jgi:hypothetical protein
MRSEEGRQLDGDIGEHVVVPMGGREEGRKGGREGGKVSGL